MPEIHFHTMPVYRLAPDKQEEWRQRKIVELAPDIGLPAEAQLGRVSWAEQHIYDTYGPWQFNEAVAYLRLYFLGSQVRGELFDSVRKKAVLTRTRVFTWRTWKLAAEEELWQPQTNQSILSGIWAYVEACKRELPKRYFDDSWLHLVGPHIDWLALLRSGQPQTSHSP